MASVPRAHVTQKFRPFKRQSLSKQSAPFFTHQKNSQKHTESHIFFSPPFASGFVCFLLVHACACAHGQSAPSVLDQLK